MDDDAHPGGTDIGDALVACVCSECPNVLNDDGESCNGEGSKEQASLDEDAEGDDRTPPFTPKKWIVFAALCESVAVTGFVFAALATVRRFARRRRAAMASVVDEEGEIKMYARIGASAATVKSKSPLEVSMGTLVV